MKTDKSSSTPGSRGYLAIIVLAVVLAALFVKCLLPGYVQFSNDGPVGQQAPDYLKLPQAMFGTWDDLNYCGWNAGAFPPHVDTLLHWALGPVGYGKLLVPIALFILGLGAWLFFRALKLNAFATTIGMFGVVLNGAWFSTACWGVASQQIAAGFDFMALALVVSITPGMSFFDRWTRIVLAGLAIGMNVMEAADIGAIFSIFIAGYVLYHTWAVSEGNPVARLARGAVRVGVIAVSAVFIAAFSVSTLIGTQIKGVAGTQQDEATKQAHWDFATQWSFPKRETLAFVVPGLFGYRMDEPDGGNYWGVGGRAPAWWHYLENGKQGPAPDPRGLRQAGGGCYAGVTAVLLVAWALFQGFRKKSSFTQSQQRLIRFWGITLLVCLLFAYGRYAPFFQFVYALPYASTIRNPGKFLHIFTLALTVLCAYGIHGLTETYFQRPLATFDSFGARFKSWWSKAPVFDRRWIVGLIVVLGVSIAGWMIYADQKPALEAYLAEFGFPGSIGKDIASFSIRQVGWYVLFLSLGIGMFVAIMSGVFSGRRALAGGILLGALLVADLGRSDLYWVKPVNYKEKLATNPVIDFLREKPFEHRVAKLQFRVPDEYGLVNAMYTIEWAQHQFPFYGVQSLDVIQLPRMPADYAAFEAALNPDGTTDSVYRITRRWQLTNTRYLLGATPLVNSLNTELAPKTKPFQIAKTFEITPKPGVLRPTLYEQLTAVLNPNGKFAVFDFTDALPRAKLYRDWHVSTNDPAILKPWAAEADKRVDPDWSNPLESLDVTDQATLYEMAAASFDPQQTVLVSTPVPNATSGTNNADATADKVGFVSYDPKHIKLHAEAAVPTVLLLNDKYDPNWQVWVDGKQAELLRCNFLMRGVHLDAGKHDVEFVFKPDVHLLYVSLAGVALGFLLLGVVIVQARVRSKREN